MTPNNSCQNGENNHLSPTGAAINITPATPNPTPMASPTGVQVEPVIKRDLVVRFTDKQRQDKQNFVKSEMAATNKNGQSGNNGSSDANHSVATPTNATLTNATPSYQQQISSGSVKDQYEVLHYSRHPHGPMSPCDSENSVCHRSRENLISTNQGKMTKTKAFNTQCTLKTIFPALNRKVYIVKIKFLQGLSKISMNSCIILDIRMGLCPHVTVKTVFATIPEKF